MVKVLLNGCCGKMGKTVTELTKNFPELKITAGIDRMKAESDFPIYTSIFDCKEEIDVILDFSRPDSLDDLLQYSADKNAALVLCTTGYSKEQLQKIHDFTSKTAIFKSANMSLGVNIVNNILKKVSSLLYSSYDIEIVEKHHNQKVDAPSGTALLLANTIKDAISENTDFVYGREGISKRNHTDIGIHAVRGGSIVGEHEVIFAGQGETIEIKHTAISREVFAYGALKACQYMYNKPTGFYSMDSMLGNTI